jgi:hypothetical protein
MENVEKLLAARDIRNLQSLYAQHVDDHRVADWAALFTENGVLQHGPTRMVGAAEMSAWLVKVQSGPKLRHLMMNPTVTVESPTIARGTLDCLLLRGEGSGWQIATTLRYTDRYEKTAGGWKFAERVIEPRTP